MACWFLWKEGKPDNPEKTLREMTRSNNKLNPHVTSDPTSAVGGECSHHCAISGPQREGEGEGKGKGGGEGKLGQGGADEVLKPRPCF